MNTPTDDIPYAWYPRVAWLPLQREDATRPLGEEEKKEEKNETVDTSSGDL